MANEVCTLTVQIDGRFVRLKKIFFCINEQTLCQDWSTPIRRLAKFIPIKSTSVISEFGKSVIGQFCQKTNQRSYFSRTLVKFSKWNYLLSQVGGSGAMWNMGQNETSLYFCMKQVLKLVSCKNRRMFRFAPCST
jgi:hypothetical protein